MGGLGYKNNIMPSGLRVVGIGGAPREGFDIEAKKRMVRERTILFSGGEGERGRGGEMRGGTHRCRLHSTYSSTSIRPRPIAMSTSLSITYRTGEESEKKRRTRKREKIRLGINADLTVDD